MNIELKNWSSEDKQSLIKICNAIDRTYLSDRIPDPYTAESADWWLVMVNKSEEKDGIFRKIVVDN